jgi:hypothetical protein
MNKIGYLILFLAFSSIVIGKLALRNTSENKLETSEYPSYWWCWKPCYCWNPFYFHFSWRYPYPVCWCWSPCWCWSTNFYTTAAYSTSAGSSTARSAAATVPSTTPSTPNKPPGNTPSRP